MDFGSSVKTTTDNLFEFSNEDTSDSLEHKKISATASTNEEIMKSCSDEEEIDFDNI